VQRKANNMQVYIVYGLGFGDDESVWEVCTVHSTQASADDAKAAILADDNELQVRVQAHDVIQ
jgi:transketolase N-terminal domain/subunit